ncbi:hypothetical protein M3Y94_01172600 [Aphelenchoides besseyi]|nr:hypothetical protein M3Y94_01172600 [Aphelenchoides besseyi]KAI6228169.1 Ubiquitin-like [Aphelenchoides besseyi]
MKIVVETTTQMQFTLEAKPSETIADLKAQIQAKEDILIDDQILLLNNISLEDDRTLSSYGIEKDPSPRLTVRICDSFELRNNAKLDENLQRILERLDIVDYKQRITSEQIVSGLRKQLGFVPHDDTIQVIRSNQEKSDLPPGLRFRGRNC